MPPQEHTNHRLESPGRGDASHETERLHVSNEQMSQHQRVPRPDQTADRTKSLLGHVDIEDNRRTDPNKNVSNGADKATDEDSSRNHSANKAQEIRQDTRLGEKISGENIGQMVLQNLEILDGAYLGRKAAEYATRNHFSGPDAKTIAKIGLMTLMPGALFIRDLSSFGFKASSEFVHGKRH